MAEALLIRETSSNASSSTGSYIDDMNVGDTIKTARTSMDSRFLKCSGQTVTSEAYPELYIAVKSRFSYNSTSGLYEYNLPSYSSTTHDKYMKVSS